jgi:hypothetical protein
MSATRTPPYRIAIVLALVAGPALAGCSGAAEAAPGSATESCGQPPARAVEWPAELTVGTRVASEADTSYLVQTDCGVLTLVRSDDPSSCWYMTGYGLQRYPC